jgi:ABC-2 type transport system ATP-binding protein
VEQLIERFQVVADRPVRELSKGNRQKIGLVLTFMHEPETAGARRANIGA